MLYASRGQKYNSYAILLLFTPDLIFSTGYFLGQFYPDMWFFWTRLQAEGGTKKFGNHWPKVMIFLCSPNNKRQAFSVWTIHEGYFDIKRIAVWDFDIFSNSCFQLLIFFPKITTNWKSQYFRSKSRNPTLCLPGTARPARHCRGSDAPSVGRLMQHMTSYDEKWGFG